MLASDDEPQQYKLFGHEFKALNQKAKVFSFTLHAFQGKAVNNIKSSAPASDLLYILNSSRKASELMDESGYEFTLDKQFVLRVSKMEAEKETIEELSEN
jgi:hypothetical protein